MFFRRKFASLETEIALLEQRMKTTEVAPAQAQATVQRLLAAVAEANAIGDLDGLRTRLEALTGVVDQRREEVKAAREQARSEAAGSRSGSSTRPSASRPRPRTGSRAASGWPSCSRSGRPPRTPTGRSRRCCGSGCRPRGTRSPSGARPTSPRLSPSATPSRPTRRSSSSRPSRWPTRPTGRARRAPTAS